MKISRRNPCSPIFSVSHPPPALLLALTTLLVSGNTLTVAGPTSFGSSDGRQHYTDQWAVKINGSEVDARRLADRHGFVYVDKVGISKFVANIKKLQFIWFISQRARI